MRASIFHLSLLVAFIFMVSTAPMSAQGNSIIFDWEDTFYLDCANGGAGEWVHFTYSLHIVSHTTEDGNGGVHSYIHFQPQSANGVGLTSGDEYVGTGLCKYSFNLASNGTTNYTEVCSFKLIGKGKTPSLKQQIVGHFTINANGELTTSFYIDDTVCE